MTPDSRISARALAVALGGWRTREPAYEALADGIRLLCLDNRLAPRTALPAERELATALGLSRTTVAAAYRSLRDSAHIESLRGSGSITRPLPRGESSIVAPDADAIDLQQASPAAWPGLAGIYAEVAGEAASLVSRPSYDVVGSLALRTAIAERYTAQGVPTRPDEVLVTTGAQSAIHQLAELYARRGTRTLIETPTYPHAAEAFRRAGTLLSAIPVTTDSGWDLDRATQAFERTRAATAYLMPVFQNPTGRSMTPEDERAIDRAAAASGTALIVDDTIADLAIDHAPRERAAFAGARTRIIRIGSLGKTVWGGLRVGWVRAETDVIRRLIAARSAHELGTPDFEQAVAVRLVRQLDDVLPQRAALLREGRATLVDGLTRALPEWRLPEVAGGVSLWVELDRPLSSALVLAARTHGVLLSAGPRFAVEGGHERHLRVPFTGPADQLTRAVDVLARAWPMVRADAGAHSPTGAPRLDTLV